MVSLKIEVKKKDVTWVVLLVAVLVVGVVYAYGSSNPAVMGHSAEEIEGLDNYATKEYVDNYATKEYVDDSVSDGSWPAGSYCIMRAGGSCPSQFSPKTIQAALGSHNHDMSPQEGPAGDSYATGGGFSNFYFYFCCK